MVARLLVLLALLSACGAPAAPLSTGALSFAPDADVAKFAEMVATRWSAATGLDVSIDPAGVRILASPRVFFIGSRVTTEDPGWLGKETCGTSETVRGATVVRTIYVATSTDSGCSASATIAHEMGHTFHDEIQHSASGVMKDGVRAGALIDAASLELVCSHADCLAFNPED